MRSSIRQFVASVSEVFEPAGPVFEFGSFQVAGQQELADLRPMFPGRDYVGCDLRPGPGVDRIEDVSNLALDDESVATIVCAETLEHVFETRRAVDEMIRVLAPGGLLIISTPFYFHIHDHPSDYWRITPSCLELLLSPLAAAIVGYQGTRHTPHTVFAIGVKGPGKSDFPRLAADFVTQFQARLRQIESSEPWNRRIKSRLRSLLLTKGERRSRHEYYDCHFTVRANCEYSASMTRYSKNALAGKTWEDSNHLAID